jgi:hypothetical protein
MEERRKAQSENDQLILQLKGALSKVKALSGLLPICAICKKIRNDAGYWNQSEDALTFKSVNTHLLALISPFD